MLLQYIQSLVYRIIIKVKLNVLRIITALMLREMSTTYGRHVAGYAWAILEPIAALTVLSIAFSLAFRAPAIGDIFPLFYATGYLPFMLWMDTSNKISLSIRFSRQLLYYPPVGFLHAILARFCISFVTHGLVFVIIMTCICIYFDYGAHLNYLAIANSLLMSSMLAIGVGTLNCFLSTYLPTWEKIWHILTRPAFLASGIFFVYGSMPEPLKSYLWYNPLIHVVGTMRQGFYPTYSADYVSSVYVYVLSIIFTTLGLLLLSLNYKKLLNDL